MNSCKCKPIRDCSGRKCHNFSEDDVKSTNKSNSYIKENKHNETQKASFVTLATNLELEEAVAVITTVHFKLIKSFDE